MSSSGLMLLSTLIYKSWSGISSCSIYDIEESA